MLYAWFNDNRSGSTTTSSRVKFRAKSIIPCSALFHALSFWTFKYTYCTLHYQGYMWHNRRTEQKIWQHDERTCPRQRSQTHNHKMKQFMWISDCCMRPRSNKWSVTTVKAVVVKDPLGTIMTTPVNLSSMTDDMFSCNEIAAAGRMWERTQFSKCSYVKNKISRSVELLLINTTQILVCQKHSGYYYWISLLQLYKEACFSFKTIF